MKIKTQIPIREYLAVSFSLRNDLHEQLFRNFFFLQSIYYKIKREMKI